VRGLIRRNSTVLRRDVRANEIRVVQQRVVVDAVEQTGEEHGEERVSRADRITNLDLESRVLGPSPVAP
jgi:ribosomal protein L10